jgi:hypothetical protein
VRAEAPTATKAAPPPARRSGTSTLIYTDSGASTLNATAQASGGVGGSTDNGIAGAGGSATATVTASSSTASSVSGTANAYGGGGGSNNTTGAYAAGGNASATASVNGNGGAGQATANATGGAGGGSETANATATVTNATTGSAAATSEAQFILSTTSATQNVTTTATAPVGAATNAITEATVNSPLQAVALSNGEVYAAAELTPGGPAIGVGGFGAESDGTATPLTYDATADFTFVTTTGEDVILNLTSGSGGPVPFPPSDTFDLVFTYQLNNGTIISDTFTSVAAADAFFDTGMAINLGDVGADTQLVDLTFTFTGAGDAPNYGMTYDLSETSPTPTIPEPSTWAMMMIGFGGLGYMSWRRVNRAKAAAA